MALNGREPLPPYCQPDLTSFATVHQGSVCSSTCGVNVREFERPTRNVDKLQPQSEPRPTLIHSFALKPPNDPAARRNGAARGLMTGSSDSRWIRSLD
jgi:hypothetical protein